MNSNKLLANRNNMSFEDILLVLTKSKWLILFFPLVVSVAFAFVLIDLPNRYKADATLVSAGSTTGKMSGQLGSLAALAGVNIGGLAGDDKTDLGIEIIVSREFVSQFIKKHNLLVPLMAAERLDMTTGQLLLDPQMYDEKSKTWVREVEPPFQAEPSEQEAHKAFLESFSVSKDKIKNLVFISFEHVSPEFAKNVVNWIVQDVNEYMRQADIQDARKSIEFLNKEADVAAVVEVKNVIYTLLEDRLKTLMIANVRQEYVFKFIEKAVSPQEKSGPKRALMLIMIYLGALFIACSFVIVRAKIRNQVPSEMK